MPCATPSARRTPPRSQSPRVAAAAASTRRRAAGCSTSCASCVCRLTARHTARACTRFTPADAERPGSHSERLPRALPLFAPLTWPRNSARAVALLRRCWRPT
eukprot:3720445-Prymnesium_polylepis.1